MAEVVDAIVVELVALNDRYDAELSNRRKRMLKPYSRQRKRKG